MDKGAEAENWKYRVVPRFDSRRRPGLCAWAINARKNRPRFVRPLIERGRSGPLAAPIPQAYSFALDELGLDNRLRAALVLRSALCIAARSPPGRPALSLRGQRIETDLTEALRSGRCPVGPLETAR